MMFIGILTVSIICLVACIDARSVMNHWIHWFFPGYPPFEENNEDE
jgi:hypothetical protein